MSVQTWWMSWDVAQREGETFCISCHTAVPYALARSALRIGGWRDSARAPRRGAAAQRHGAVSGCGQKWRPNVWSRGGRKRSSTVLSSQVDDARDSRLSDDARLAFDHLWEMQAGPRGTTQVRGPGCTPPSNLGKRTVVPLLRCRAGRGRGGNGAGGLCPSEPANVDRVARLRQLSELTTTTTRTCSTS